MAIVGHCVIAASALASALSLLFVSFLRIGMQAFVTGLTWLSSIGLSSECRGPAQLDSDTASASSPSRWMSMLTCGQAVSKNLFAKMAATCMTHRTSNSNSMWSAQMHTHKLV